MDKLGDVDVTGTLMAGVWDDMGAVTGGVGKVAGGFAPVTEGFIGIAEGSVEGVDGAAVSLRSPPVCTGTEGVGAAAAGSSCFGIEPGSCLMTGVGFGGGGALASRNLAGTPCAASDAVPTHAPISWLHL